MKILKVITLLIISKLQEIFIGIKNNLRGIIGIICTIMGLIFVFSCCFAFEYKWAENIAMSILFLFVGMICILIVYLIFLVLKNTFLWLRTDWRKFWQQENNKR